MHKTSVQFAALFLSSVALSTYADVEREFSVDDFDSVTVSQGINLNLVMGSAPSVTAVAEKDSDLDRLEIEVCLLYTSPSPRDGLLSRMPSSA